MLKLRRIRKEIQKYLPAPFRDRDDERMDYIVEILKMVVQILNEILKRLGGEPWPNAKQSDPWKQSFHRQERSFSIFSWVVSMPARIANRFTNYRIGRVKRMKWLRPEFLTFVVGALVVLLNDQFGWGLTQEGVIAFFTTVGGYLLTQGIVNVKRGQDGTFAGVSVQSRKMIFTLVGALFIGLNEAMQLGFGQDAVWTVAGLVTGYNALEGTRDVKTAIPTLRVDLSRPEDQEADDQTH